MVTTIAVIDDDSAILDAFSMLLGDYGWRVLTYRSGEAFFDDLEQVPTLQCLILEPHLPGMSGADIVRALAQSDIQIPTVGLTARPDSPITSTVIEFGVQKMLTKPADAEKLLETVKTAINNY